MQPTRHVRNLALVGFMGTGKTSVGRLVASQLRFRFLDTDDLIEQRAGQQISEIFQHQGEPAFRALERDIVSELAKAEKSVISTGGGLVVNPANMDSLKEHALVVCLWATPETIYERTRYASHRPLLQQADPMTRIRNLLTEREPYYRAADVLMSVEHRSLQEIVAHVVHEFRSALQRRV